MEKKPNRGLVHRKAFSNSIDLKLFGMFEALSVETRISKSRLLDEAIKLLLQHYGKSMI